MPRTPTLRILGLVAISALLAASRADADDPIGILPGMVCQPIDEASASDILRNSAGTIANMSSTHPAWVQCPIRMPAVVSPDQTLEWRARFLAPTTESCLLRIAMKNGELVGSILGIPTSEVLLSAALGDYGATELVASVRCKLPPSDTVHGPAGITTIETRIY